MFVLPLNKAIDSGESSESPSPRITSNKSSFEIEKPNVFNSQNEVTKICEVYLVLFTIL